MVTLYAVRHGETNYNHEERVQGSRESVLTENGVQQAEALAEHFGKIPLTSLFSSPLVRARNTANIILDRSNLDSFQVVDGFQEINCGIFEGMLMSDIKKTRWQEFLSWLADPMVAAPGGGGESLNHLYKRVSNALDKIISGAGENDTIAIVSHAGVIRMMLVNLIRVHIRLSTSFGLSNASIATFAQRRGRWNCFGWNFTGHLGNLEGDVKLLL